MRTYLRPSSVARVRQARPLRHVVYPAREPARPRVGLLSWRRLAAEPFVCFLLLFAIMMAMMAIAAVHRTGMSRALLGNWAHVRW